MNTVYSKRARGALYLAAFAATVGLLGCAHTPNTSSASAGNAKGEDKKVALSPQELDKAEAWFRSSFRGGPGMAQELARLNQDETQRVCGLYKNDPPAAEAKRLEALNKAMIQYPPDNRIMGDWKEGQKIFNAGFAYRIGTFIPSSPTATRGGNCYACHQGEAQEVAYGNLGPSLLHYGKLRGQSPEIQRYTYEKIFNAKAYNACSGMPRLGHNGLLTPTQVAHLTAYLLSPESPINK